MVDIGGGIGSLEIALTKAKANGTVNFTIFDIPETIENAKKVCPPFEPTRRVLIICTVCEDLGCSTRGSTGPAILRARQLFGTDLGRDQDPSRPADISHSARPARLDR